MRARVLSHALLVLAASACGGGEPEPSPRGILLITIDTLRADHVGGPGSLTPALDHLAAEGVVVEDAFTPTPTTGPAHASLFSGLHPWKHRVLDNALPLGQRHATLAEIARAQGYATAAVVSSFVLHPRFGLDRGFDDYRFEASRPMDWRGAAHERFYARGQETTDRASERLAELAAEGPGRFFLWVHYFDPHAPYDPPEAFREATGAPVDLSGKTLPDMVPSHAVLEELIRRYRGEVRYTDAAIGRLLARLDELGIADETAVIVTSDHGEGLGDHGHMDHGVNLFDELVRVPLVIRAPGLPRGRRLAGPAQLEDLFPTLVALMGAPPPADVDGIDLLPWLRGDVEQSPRPAVVGRRKTYAGRPALYYEWRAGRKWIGEIGAAGELYATDSDRRESSPDVGAGAPAWLRSRTAGSEPAEPARSALDPDVEEGLKALGYVR